MLIDGNLTFSPLAARLLAELAREVATWSAGNGLTRVRGISVAGNGHEAAAVRAAANARRL